MELLIAVGLFGMIFGIVYFTLASRTPIAEDAIQRRLETIALQPRPSKPGRLEQTEDESFWEQVANFFIGAKDMPETYSRISRRLHQAGYRGVRAGESFGVCAYFSVWRSVSAVWSRRSRRMPGCRTCFYWEESALLSDIFCRS